MCVNDVAVSKNRFLGSMLHMFSLAEERLGTLEMFSIKDGEGLQFKLNMDGSLKEANKMRNTLNELLDYNEDIVVSVKRDKKESYVVLVSVRGADWDLMQKEVGKRIITEVKKYGSGLELYGGKKNN